MIQPQIVNVEVFMRPFMMVCHCSVGSNFMYFCMSLENNSLFFEWYAIRVQTKNQSIVLEQ